MSRYSHTFWTREEIIVAMRRWLLATGKAPTIRDWYHAGPGHPCAQTVIRAFGGSFLAALDEAGIKRERRSDAKWTRETIVNAMLDWVLVQGRWPSQWDWQLASATTPPANTVRHVFGSWVAAKKAAGWLPNQAEPKPDECAGCGTERDNETVGCNVCWNRHHKRGRSTQRRMPVAA